MAVVATQRRRSGDILWQRKRNARRAERKLGEARAAMAAGDSLAALRGVRSALLGLIGDFRNVVAEGLTASEADAALAQTGVPVEERKASPDCWKRSSLRSTVRELQARSRRRSRKPAS